MDDDSGGQGGWLLSMYHPSFMPEMSTGYASGGRQIAWYVLRSLEKSVAMRRL
jgi:hypothetical protein